MINPFNTRTYTLASFLSPATLIQLFFHKFNNFNPTLAFKLNKLNPTLPKLKKLNLTLFGFILLDLGKKCWIQLVGLGKSVGLNLLLLAYQNSCPYARCYPLTKNTHST